uniref:NADH-ubiquinone oxidoreductase chain 3 n=1 Tax=Prionospio multibranchiata TaxID=3050093 RepID=A0AAU6QG75_9ANNE
MLMPTLTSMIALLISLAVMLISYLLSMRTFKDREKSTPFECGFDPKDKARLPFSTRFFLLAVIFLIFDIEIVLLMPTPLILSNSPSNYFLMAIFIFMLILLLGTLHEWREGSLSWTN